MRLSSSRFPALLLLALLGLFAGAGCEGLPPGLEGGFGEGTIAPEWHDGPPVYVDDSGPARFTETIARAFRPQRAMEMVRKLEVTSIAPGNGAYDEQLDYLASLLRDHGFDGTDERMTVSFLETEMEFPAWTPVSASLELRPPGEAAVLLHEFDSPVDTDRSMLPVYAVSCDVTGPVVMELGDIQEGSVFVTDVPLKQVIDRARQRGAAAVISSSNFDFCVDPSGQERHLDAIQYRTLPGANEMPVAQISPRSYRRIELAVMRTGSSATVHLALKADVLREERPLRTLVATISGAERPEEAVTTVAHAQEWGASDNCSGVAGLAEGVITLADLLRHGDLPWPQRTLVFLWGDEMDQSEIWLEATKLEPIAGISCDMIGESAATGAIALLERGPDPAALVALPPDEHTPWGLAEIDGESLMPNGLAIVARCAMVDMGLGLPEGWECRDHPYEGGSDHEIFHEHGVPGVLFWHFTDFTYHTNLDRIEFVDPEEIRRTSVAVLATALAVADAKPTDLRRYLLSLDAEIEVRIAAAENAEDEELVAMWKEWSRGSRQWLRNLCLGIDEELPVATDR